MRFARLTLAAAVAVATGCVTQGGGSSPAPAPPLVAASPSPDPDFDAARHAPPSSSKPRPASEPDSPTPEPAREMLKRALEGMGGAGTVDRVRTLLLTGRTKRYLDSDGLAPEVPFRTTIVFPRSYRQDLLTPTGPLSTILSSEGAYLAGEPGQPPLRLPEVKRREIEAAVMRTPLVLLKTRRDPTFDVFGTARAAEAPFEQLTVWSGGESTVLSLEPGTGRIVRLQYEMRASPGTSGAKISIAYSDFRDVDGLVHAFHVIGVREDRPLFETWIEQLVVNQDVDPALFRVEP